MTEAVFGVCNQLLKAVKHEVQGKDILRSYKDLLIALNKLLPKEIDIFLKVIALLLNCSNDTLPPQSKFQLIYFLKVATSVKAIPENLKLSLQNQEYLFKTLIFISLYNREQGFPRRGEGMFSSRCRWLATNTNNMSNIANNIIGLTLELLRYWGQKQSHENIFGAIYQNLVSIYGKDYPDLNVYFDNLASCTRVEWRSKVPQKSLMSIPDVNSRFHNAEIEENFQGKEPEKIINKNVNDLMDKLKEIGTYASSVSSNRTFADIIDKFIDLQIDVNRLKIIFKECLVLELPDTLFDLCRKAKSAISQAEELLKHLTSFLEEEIQDINSFFKTFASTTAKESLLSNEMLKSVSDKSSISTGTIRLESSIIISEGKKSALPSNNSKLSSQSNASQNSFNNLQPEKQPSDSAQIPMILQKKYKNHIQISRDDEVVTYRAEVSTESEESRNNKVRIILISRFNWENLKHRNVFLEVFWRKTIQHQAIKPLIEHSFGPSAGILWFVEPDFPSLRNSPHIITTSSEFFIFLKQINEFSLYLKKNHNLILEEFQADDITYDELKKQFMIQNWYKASDYYDISQEYKLLRSLGLLVISILGYSKSSEGKSKDDWLRSLSSVPVEWERYKFDDKLWESFHHILSNCLFPPQVKQPLDSLFRLLEPQILFSFSEPITSPSLRFELTLYNPRKISVIQYLGDPNSSKLAIFDAPIKSILYPN